MDAVFQEEKKALSETKHKIEDAAFRLEKNISNQNEKISSFVCVDYADRQELAGLRAEARKMQKRAEELRGYLDSPYFGRMDLDVEGEDTTEVIYVGKTGISVDHNFLVSDWRSPIGQYFYMKSERNFRVGNVDYVLQLRRALEINGGKLLSYRTEFDGETVALEGDVIDPFLLTVLKDKRRQNRLTDIIKSIQGNQNNIIRRPRNESFIVQGCAGSGKTMILLHRLSYLMFNYRNISAENIKIITPNSLFDAHINELSSELGLDRIERKSVEEFYVSIIKGFSKKMDVSAEVSSEKGLNNELLKTLYSEKYFEDSCAHYNSYWSEILSQINGLNISNLAERMELIYPILSEHDYTNYSKLNSFMRQLSRNIADEISKRNKLAEQVSFYRKEIKRASEDEKSLSVKLEELANSTKVFLEESIEKNQATIEQLAEAATEQEANINLNQKELEDLSEESQRKKEHLKSIQGEIVYLTDYGTVLKRTDDFAKELLHENQEQIDKILQIEEDFKRTPIYNFGKKNKLKDQLAIEIKMFNEQAMKFVSLHLSLGYESLKEIDERILELRELISEGKQQFEKGKQILRNLEQEIRILSRCLDLFIELECPDITYLDKKTYRLVPPELKKYEEAYKAATGATRYLESVKKSLSEYEMQYETVTKLHLTEEDAKTVNTAIELVGKLKISEISRNVMMKDMVDAYRAYGEKYRSTNYRHKLYIKILFCYLYYRISSVNNGNFINIDEAQDISKAEYRLMRLVLGKNCVFNLYGDVNQLVYEYKGIGDWDELKSDISEVVYTLNENYRNTLQITDFCNKEFKSDIYPIGISGRDVLERNLDGAVTWICDVKKDNPELRTAIVFRHGHSGIIAELKKKIDDSIASWFEIDEDKISILSVEKAKGLEFDVVVSVVDGMTMNEKYISYTRALDSLVVVREHFEHLVENTEILEDEILEDEILVDETNEGDAKVVEFPVEITIGQVESNNDVAQTNIPQLDFGEQNPQLINDIMSIIKEAMGEELDLSEEQTRIVQLLASGSNLACSAPSGWKKSIILLALAKYSHYKDDKQSILTAEGHLQENELVLAERMGLKAGSITDSMKNFKADFKKEKYDIIFVPYDFFAFDDNVKEFVEYFSGKISYWGVDHPSEELILWKTIKQTINDLHVTPYLMSKNGFDGLDLDGFQVANIADDSEPIENLVHTISFVKEEDKKRWLSEHAIAELWGQGLVYCETEEECKEISKLLRKKKVKAEAYIHVSESDNVERINYLANTFSKGGLPVLVTTHNAGKNLSNANIRFIVHFSVPTDSELYSLHISQIGKIAENPIVFDLKS